MSFNFQEISLLNLLEPQPNIDYTLDIIVNRCEIQNDNSKLDIDSGLEGRDYMEDIVIQNREEQRSRRMSHETQLSIRGLNPVNRKFYHGIRFWFFGFGFLYFVINLLTSNRFSITRLDKYSLL